MRRNWGGCSRRRTAPARARARGMRPAGRGPLESLYFDYPTFTAPPLPDLALQSYAVDALDPVDGWRLLDDPASLRDVVRTRMYLVDADDFEAIGAVHGEMMSEAMPVNTTVVVAGLLDPRWKIELEVEAVLPTDDARDRNR